MTSATEPDQTSSPSPATIPVRQVSKLVEDGSHGSAERIGRKLTNTVAAVAGQADAAVKGFASEPLLLTGNFVRGALTLVESTVGDLLAPAAPLLQAVGAPGSSRSLPPAAGPVSLSPQGTTGWSPAPSIAAPGVVETVAAASEAAEPFAGRWEASPVSAPATSASLLPRAGGGSAGGPTPSDVPSPAPGSPGAVASGSGGPIFVPIAALLALLALAAPAALRRLREVPDFRPPIPFVCALERPG